MHRLRKDIQQEKHEWLSESSQESSRLSLLRTVWRVRTHEVLEQGIPIVHRNAPRCGQAPYSRTSVAMRDLSRPFRRVPVERLVGLQTRSGTRDKVTER